MVLRLFASSSSFSRKRIFMSINERKLWKLVKIISRWDVNCLLVRSIYVSQTMTSNDSFNRMQFNVVCLIKRRRSLFFRLLWRLTKCQSKKFKNNNSLNFNSILFFFSLFFKEFLLWCIHLKAIAIFNERTLNFSNRNIPFDQGIFQMPCTYSMQI